MIRWQKLDMNLASLLPCLRLFILGAVLIQGRCVVWPVCDTVLAASLAYRHLYRMEISLNYFTMSKTENCRHWHTRSVVWELTIKRKVVLRRTLVSAPWCFYRTFSSFFSANGEVDEIMIKKNREGNFLVNAFVFQSILFFALTSQKVGTLSKRKIFTNSDADGTQWVFFFFFQ